MCWWTFLYVWQTAHVLEALHVCGTSNLLPPQYGLLLMGLFLGFNGNLIVHPFLGQNIENIIKLLDPTSGSWPYR